MNNKSAEILTAAINEMRAGKLNDVEIAINLMAASVPVLLEAVGSRITANHLRSLVLQVEQESDSLDSVN